MSRKSIHAGCMWLGRVGVASACQRGGEALLLCGMKRTLALFSLAAFVFLGGCNAKEPEAAAGAVKAEGAVASKVRMKTSVGDIVVELNGEQAPITVKNFLKYVVSGHYAGTVFHRVIDGFMIQGGGMALEGGNLMEKATGAGIKNESSNGLKNERGTIAMARTGVVDSATAQFFINVVDNENLNFPKGGGYTVFGKVIEGMDVVDQIKGVKTGAEDVPVVPIVIESVKAE